MSSTGSCSGDDAIPYLVGALDALPSTEPRQTLDRLRARQREFTVELAAEREQGPASFFGWNLARERARAALAGLPES